MCDKCNAEYEGDSCDCPDDKSASAEPVSEKSAEDQAKQEAAEQGEKLASALIDAANGASDEQRAIVVDIVKAAEADAENAVNYLAGYLQQKQAMGDYAENDMAAEDVMGAASEGEGAEAAEAIPAEAAPAEGEVGAGDEAAAVAELVQALQDAGVTPEELAAMVSGGGAEEAAAPEALPPELAVEGGAAPVAAPVGM
jgi:hypothetical protein